MKIINHIILYIIIGTLLSSCSHNHDHSGHDHGHNHGDETESHSENDGHGHGHGGEHAEGEIHLTKDQIETMNIKFGDFSKVKINDFIKATGTIDLPSSAYAAVSSKISGLVSDCKKYVVGSYVEEGTIIASVENPELMEKQQEFMELQAEISYLRIELERQKKLVDANAGVLKNVQKTQSEINVKDVTSRGISKYLDYYGIETSNLTTDRIIERISVVTPVSGYVTSVNLHKGMYVSPEMELLEIANENQAQLKLDVFEKDIAEVKKGMSISYTIPAMGTEIYEGSVTMLGRAFDIENKTLHVRGNMKKKRPRFVKDVFLEAKLWLNDKTVDALPEKAIIRDGTSSYIYVANDKIEGEELQFEAIRVVEGGTTDGFSATKLIDEIPDSMRIVTEGAYFVFAQSKAGELKHEH